MWVRLDDHFDDNAKVNEVSNAAAGVYAKGLTWSARNEKDGVVPRGIARKLAGPDGQAAIDELVTARLWIEHEDGYLARDFLQFNPSAADVRARRETKKEAGKKGAKSRWDGSKRPAAMAPPIAPAMADGWHDDAPDPVPEETQTPKPPSLAGQGASDPSLSDRTGLGPNLRRNAAGEIESTADPQEFRENLRRYGQKALGCGATSEQDCELAEHLAGLYADGWTPADAVVAGEFAAAGGLRGKRGRRPDVDWLVRAGGGNLVALLERSRVWDQAGRPALDERGEPVAPKPAEAPKAPRSLHATGALDALNAKRAALAAARTTGGPVAIERPAFLRPTGTDGGDRE
jgi:hypothetical protein